MFAALLPYLICPACAGELTLLHAQHEDQAEIVAGALACRRCRAQYPIRDGVLDLLPPARPTNAAQWTNELGPTAWAYERLWRPYALTLLSGQRLPYTKELPIITSWAAPRADGFVVDLACSNGLYARALAAAFPQRAVVVGVDRSMPMLQDARQRARAARLPISYLRAEAGQLPFQPGMASVVTIGGSLNEIGDLEACLREVRRTLAPGGRMIAMTLTQHPARFERAVQNLLRPGGIQFWPAEQLIEHMATAGLRATEQRVYGIVLFSLAIAD